MGETERSSIDKVKLLEKTVELINEQQVKNAKFIKIELKIIKCIKRYQQYMIRVKLSKL